MKDSRWGRRVLVKTLGLVGLLFCVSLFSGEGARAAVPSPLRFSDPPRDAEFLRMGLFAQPLVPVGVTSDDENRALSRAVVAYDEARRRGAEDAALESLATFLRVHSATAWRASLLLDLGALYRETGHFSKALETWEQAWDASRGLTDANGRALGDASLAALSQFEAYLGRKELLAPLLEQAKRRAIHGTAAELVSESARGLAEMEQKPEIAFRCGPMALKRILRSNASRDSTASAVAALDRAPSTPRGISLTSVQRFATSAGMRFQMAFRDVGAPVVLPAVAHWKVGHYAAIIRRDELGRYRVEDPTFGENVRMEPSTLDAEASGYFLVPEGPLPQGWRAVDAAEGDRVWGRGDTGNNKDNGDTGPGGPCTGGCTTWSVEPMVVGLALHDIPVGYHPPVGPQLRFEMVYSHRDVQQPAIFTYVNMGPKWTTTWLSYVTDNIATNGTVDLYRRGGGDEPFTFDSGSATSHPGQFSQSIVTRRTDSGGNTTGFSRLMKDGSTEDFSLAMGTRFFMTSFADPQGNKVAITYDAQMRITKVTDAIGQDTTVAYENPADPLKITKVTDPFGRSATFTYNAAGQLASTTDVLGITSSYDYGANDFVQKLTTPYGSSTFTYGDITTDSSLFTTRFVEATDALGRTSRVEFTQGPPGMATSDPTVPTGLPLENVYLEWRNTFVWDPVQYQAAKGPTGFDHTKATILHWLHTADDTATSRTLESTKSPLENRVWYTYPNQTGTAYTVGSTNNVTGVGRVLDDGSSKVETYAYNAMGQVTEATDATGRKRSLTYAPNGIDLVGISNTTAGANDTLMTATYNAQHEPLTFTGANGQTTRFEYNATGQLTKRTDAQGNATTYGYDGKGYLTTIQGPDPKATVTLTYDPMGRIATATDVAGRTVTYAYDAADRITSATYPDGTIAKLGYQNLDLTTITDRLGQTTTLAYDSERQLVSAIDALANSTKYGYSTASKLTSLTDPNGHTTSWTRDLEGRVTGKTFADNTSSSLTYESTTSRVHVATDAEGQTTTYGYALDGSMTSLVRAGAGGAESLAFTYDPAYPRPATMTDAIGLTSYGYIPVGALGANQIGSVTSPVAGAPAGTNDTVSYTYDELDRIVGRNVDGAADSTSFDALGRMTTVTNPLDTFTYAYADATERVSGITSQHGPSMSFAYNDAKGDELVREIDATGANASPLAKMTYAYNADDNVTSFTQAYLGKELTASGAGGMVAPWTKGLGNQPKTSTKRDADSPKANFAIFLAWCTPFLLALFALLRGNARRRFGWLVPALLGVFLGGCGGCSSNDNGATSPNDGTTYVYDAANRVTATQGQGPASYAYDAASNLTSVTTSAASSAGGTAPQSYSYSSTNGIGGATYDANGSPTSLGGASYTWDSANRLASATIGSTRSTFSYDGLSRLVRIVDKNGGNVVADRAFTWCGAERCAAHDNLQGGSPVVTRYFQQGIVDGGQPLYEVRDRLGSVRQVVDQSGKVRAQYDYDPYGNRTKLAGDLDSEIGYAGYYHHAASGLDLTLYRAYDAAHGRWLNRDPVGEAGGTNLYGYVAGNPVNWIDPSGHDPLILIGAALGALGDLAWQLATNGGNLSCVSWSQVGAAALAGAAVGAIGPVALDGEFVAGLIADEGGALRVFWSGGEAAESAATEFAEANGGETLGMTPAGQSVANWTDGMPWSEQQPLWAQTSTDFANGASGEVHAFVSTTANPSSIWFTYELPALEGNPDVTEIIIHVVTGK